MVLFPLLTGYILSIFKGIYRIYIHFATLLWGIWKKTPFWDKVLYISLGGFVITTILPWKEYFLIIDGEKIDHGIYTDDFGLFFIAGFLVASTKVLIQLFPFKKLAILVVWGNTLVLASTVVLYLLNLTEPDRITPAELASFSEWFYIAGVLLMSTFIASVLGIFMPRTRAKNEMERDPLFHR